MDRRGNLAAGARHAAVGDQGDGMAAVLDDAERRNQLVQFRHAVGARALETDDDYAVAVERALLEGVEHLALVGKAEGRRFDRPALPVDRAALEDATAEIALHKLHAAVGQER